MRCKFGNIVRNYELTECTVKDGDEYVDQTTGEKKQGSPQNNLKSYKALGQQGGNFSGDGTASPNTQEQQPQQVSDNTPAWARA